MLITRGLVAGKMEMVYSFDLLVVEYLRLGKKLVTKINSKFITIVFIMQKTMQTILFLRERFNIWLLLADITVSTELEKHVRANCDIENKI